MGLRVTVLGSSGGYAGPGKACSGFLLQRGGSSLLLDIGSGVVSRLLEYVGADALGGLVVSHLHYDHYVDIYGLLTARRFWEKELPPLPALLPPGAEELIGCPLSERSRPRFFECLDMREMESGGVAELDGFQVEALPGVHPVQCFILRVASGGASVCYSGDTDRCDSLLELARGSDLFICEATFTGQVARKQKGHLYASEAGEIAREAGAKRLLVTHVWPTLDEDLALREAEESFGGPVMLASEGSVIEI